MVIIVAQINRKDEGLTMTIIWTKKAENMNQVVRPNDHFPEFFLAIDKFNYSLHNSYLPI